MADIFFKCEACGKHLVADDAGAGVTINCPDCNAATTISKMVIVHQCPQCKQSLKFAAEMKGEAVRCSACHNEIVLPGQSATARAAQQAKLVAFVCPKCHAELEAPEEMSEKQTTCPSCQQQVHLTRKLKLRSSTAAEPTQTTGMSPTIHLPYTPSDGEERPAQGPLYGRFGTKPKLWNPKAAVWYAFWLTPAFGAWFLARNWRVLGEKRQAKINMLWFWSTLGMKLLLDIINWMPLSKNPLEPSVINFATGSTILIIALAWYLAWYFISARKQIKYVKVDLQARYEKKSWQIPVLVGLLFMGVDFGISTLLKPSVPEPSVTQSPSAAASTNMTPASLSHELSVTEISSRVKPLILAELRKKPDLANATVGNVILFQKGGNTYDGSAELLLNGEREIMPLQVSLEGDMIRWELKPVEAPPPQQSQETKPAQSSHNVTCPHCSRTVSVDLRLGNQFTCPFCQRQFTYTNPR